MALYDPGEKPRPEPIFPLTIYLLDHPVVDIADARRASMADPGTLYAWGRVNFHAMRVSTARYAALFQRSGALWDNVPLRPEIPCSIGVIVCLTLEAND